MFYRIYWVVFFLVSSIISIIVPQGRGSSGEIRETKISANDIKTVIFNYGSINKPNYLGNLFDFTYNGLGYLFEFGPVVGTKVRNSSGDSIIIFSDPMVLSSQGDYNPDGTVKWGWLPRPGYANPNSSSIARKTDPQSWPAAWSIWPTDSVLSGATEELYYVMDDFTNREFSFFPHAQDTSIRGLGLSCKVRIFQFGGRLSKSVIIKYTVKNEGTAALSNIWFSFFGDPHVGGPGDYIDDNFYFSYDQYSERFPYSGGLISFMDLDGKGDGGLKTGNLNFMPLSWKHTPVYSFAAPQYGEIFPKDDIAYWNILQQGVTVRDSLGIPMDNAVVFSEEPFALAPGAEKDVYIALFISENLYHSIEDANELKFRYLWRDVVSEPGAYGGDQNYEFTIQEHPQGTVSGTVNIAWNSGSAVGAGKQFIEISSNSGNTWMAVKHDLPPSGTFQLNTQNYNDGKNYILRLIAYHKDNSSKYFYRNISGKFIINNAGVNGKPEVASIAGLANLQITRLPFDFDVLVEDADGDNLTGSLYIQVHADSAEIPLFLNQPLVNGTNTIRWPDGSYPNRNTYKMRFVVSDGTADSTILADSISLEREAGIFQNNHVQHSAGISDGTVTPFVSDHRNLSINSTYEITFKNKENVDSVGYITVKKNPGNSLILFEEPLSQNGGTSVFDGLYLKVKDFTTHVNTAKSGFVQNNLNAYVNYQYPPPVGAPNMHRRLREDWMIVFNSLDTNVSGQYMFPGDTVQNQFLQAVVTPFRVRSVTNNAKGNVLVFENTAALRNGRWDVHESIIFRPGDIIANPLQLSWGIRLSLPDSVRPGAGDTLYLYTVKSLTPADTFLFVADSSYILTEAVEGNFNPKEYTLEQNYPNPFNPVSNITFGLPTPSVVSLIIYDILGREMAELVDEFRPAGRYTVAVDAGRFASGIYFYELKSGNIRITKKMVVIK